MSPEPASSSRPPAGQTTAGALPEAEPPRRRRWAARCGAAALAVTVTVTGVVPAQAASPNPPPRQQVSGSSDVRPAHPFGPGRHSAAGIRIPAPYRQVAAAPTDGVEPSDPSPTDVGTAAG